MCWLHLMVCTTFLASLIWVKFVEFETHEDPCLYWDMSLYLVPPYLLVIFYISGKPEITNTPRQSAAVTACLLSKKHRPGEEQQRLRLKDFLRLKSLSEASRWALKFPSTAAMFALQMRQLRLLTLQQQTSSSSSGFSHFQQKGNVALSWQHRQLSVTVLIATLFLILNPHQLNQRG